MDCNCGKRAEAGDKFCRNCGEQLAEELFNCECGAEVFKTDKFCHGCGAPFSVNGVCECGTALAENAKFCHLCGKEVLIEFVSEAPEEPVQKSADEPIENNDETKGYYRPNTDGNFTFVKGKQPSSQAQ